MNADTNLTERQHTRNNLHHPPRLQSGSRRDHVKSRLSETQTRQVPVLINMIYYVARLHFAVVSAIFYTRSSVLHFGFQLAAN